MKIRLFEAAVLGNKILQISLIAFYCTIVPMSTALL